jgi:3-hydroxybutyrate dehydrogenase
MPSEQPVVADAADGRLLEGHVAIVTGSEGALGRAIVHSLAQRGAQVIGVDIGGKADYTVDITSSEQTRQLVVDVFAEHGRLDVLALNAGIQHMAPIEDFPLERWEALLAVMLTAPFTMMSEAWPHLARSGHGRVVATASTSSFVAERYKAAYVAAKHGLLGLIKVAALEGADVGITANAVAPSWMRTPMVEGQVAERSRLLGQPENEVIAALVHEQAVKRFVEPAEVAETVAFLASGAASGITGTCIPVDLGALA